MKPLLNTLAAVALSAMALTALAKALLQYLSSPQAQPVVQSTGLDPVSR